MSDGSLGFLSIAAFKKSRGLYGAGPAISYPETPGASSLAANHMIPFKSESLSESISRAVDGSITGAGREGPATVTKREYSGSLSSNLRWCGLERLIMCAMGFEIPDDSPVDLGPGSGAYAHIFELDEALQHQAWKSAECGTYTPPSSNDRKVRSGMLGFYKEQFAGGNDDWIFNGVMIDKMTITGNPDEVIISFDVIAYDVARGSYNHSNWTLPGGSESMALFQQLTFQLGAFSSGFGGLADYDINMFELTLENNMAGGEQSVQSGEHIIQPVRDGFRTVKLKITFPRFNSNNSSLIAMAGIDMKMMGMLEFEGPTIASTYKRLHGLYLPTLHFTDETKANIDSPGAIKPEFSFIATRPDGSDPFVGNKYHGATLKKDGELVWVVQNEFATNYLLEN